MSTNFVRLRSGDTHQVQGTATIPVAPIPRVETLGANVAMPQAQSQRIDYRFRWIDLLTSVLFSSVLAFTWTWPVSRALWDDVDRVLYRFANGMLAMSWTHTGWAYANHRYFDIVGIALFGIVLLASAGPAKWRSGLLSVGLLAILVVLAQSICHTALALNTVASHRASPSLVFDDGFRLSVLVPEIRAKDASESSFPGDHGVAALCALIYLGYRGGRITSILGAMLTTTFIMPRLVSGAHWFSDIAVGSTSIAMLTTALLMATPLHDWLSGKIAAMLRIRE